MLPDVRDAQTMTEFPLYMLVGDVLVPIGTAEAAPTIPDYIKISGELDVFPGARLTFSKIVNWEEFLTYARALYPEGFITVTNNDPVEAAEKIVKKDPPPADLADKVKEALAKEQGKKK